LQLGAEIYGCATWQADLEAITLLLKTLSLAGLDQVYLDLSHAGILNGILANENLPIAEMETLYGFLQSKDRPRLSGWAQSLPEQTAKALLALTELNGPCAEVLSNAKKALPQTPEVKEALAQLAHLIDSANDLSQGLELSIDLADLRGYQYHSGVMFAAYVEKLPQPIARGGRYDQVGKAFGRARPATGFSLDLLTLASLSPNPKPKNAILAPWDNDAQLKQSIDALRQAGEVVIQLNAGESMQSAEYVCDRELVKQGGKWTVNQK